MKEIQDLQNRLLVFSLEKRQELKLMLESSVSICCTFSYLTSRTTAEDGLSAEATLVYRILYAYYVYVVLILIL